MFTGIIKATGIVEQSKARGGDIHLTIRSEALPWQEYETGESICVNGVCLTATGFNEHGFTADVSRETVDVTTLGRLDKGARVNLEPSLGATDRLGGHFVTGHVDCVGTVRSRSTAGQSIRLEIEIPADYRRYLARKGSVCVDGVSLTINAVSGNCFEVNIIPHTADVTIIHEYAKESVVNIEVDMLARYLERLLSGG
jgi:riboflavin synthase